MAVRKSSGEKAAEEAKARQSASQERAEKAQKAAAEGGVTPTAPPVENRQDVFAVAGDDLRVGADPDGPFELDRKAIDAAKPVDRIAVAATADRLVVVIDGTYNVLDVEQGLALRRLVNAAATNLNF